MTTYSGWHPDDLQADKELLTHRKRFLLSLIACLKEDAEKRAVCIHTRECLLNLHDGIDNLIADYLDAPLSSIKEAEADAAGVDWGVYGELSR